MSGVIEDGMAQMSAKFKEMGEQVYLDAEKVKAPKATNHRRRPNTTRRTRDW